MPSKRPLYLIIFAYLFSASATAISISFLLFYHYYHNYITEYTSIELLFVIFVISLFFSIAINFLISKLIASHIIDYIRTITFNLKNKNNRLKLNKINLSEIDKLINEIENTIINYKKAAKKYKDELKNLKLVLDNMKECVFLIDNKKRLITINNSGRLLFHIHKEKIFYRPINSIIRDLKLNEFIDNVLKKGEDIETELSLWTGKEGIEKREFFVRAVTVKNEKGEVSGALIVMDDRTELKNLEALRQEFVANVSHELKTPVTAIKGYSETLLDMENSDTETMKNFLSTINRQSLRLEKLVDNILLLSKIEAKSRLNKLNKTPSDICAILKLAKAACLPMAKEKDISIYIECENDLPLVNIDEFLFEQAINNLLGNAIKFSYNKGKVILAARKLNGSVEIEIKDFGIGISKEHLPRIFERFFVANKKKSKKEGGTGLGLSIVKHIVQAHDGKIEVKSTLKKGTTFKIKLPC